MDTATVAGTVSVSVSACVPIVGMIVVVAVEVPVITLRKFSAARVEVIHSTAAGPTL